MYVWRHFAKGVEMFCPKRFELTGLLNQHTKQCVRTVISFIARAAVATDAEGRASY